MCVCVYICVLLVFLGSWGGLWVFLGLCVRAGFVWVFSRNGVVVCGLDFFCQTLSVLLLWLSKVLKISCL